MEAVVNVTMGKVVKPQYHRLWAQPLTLTKGFNMYLIFNLFCLLSNNIFLIQKRFNCVLVVESDETFMCTMNAHNNLIIPEILRMDNAGECDVQTIISKSVAMIKDLASLKDVTVR